jgi:hypothetical protein
LRGLGRLQRVSASEGNRISVSRTHPAQRV